MPGINILQQLGGNGGIAPQLQILPNGTIGSINSGLQQGGIAVSNGGLQVVPAGSTTGTISGNTNPGTATPTGNTTTPSTIPNTTTAPTGQGTAAAPVSPAKVWYQNWKVWLGAAAVIGILYFMYQKARKK